MVILYRGQIQEIHRELEKYGTTLDRCYRELLGEGADSVAREADRLLTPDCFWESVEQARRYENTFPDGAPNRFAFFNTKKLCADATGHVRPEKIQVSAAFYITEDGFRRTTSAKFTDRQIASYVHEFNHFVWYVLQQVPVYLGLSLFEDIAGIHYPHTNRAEFEKVATLEESERLKRITCFAHANITRDQFEKATRLLDNLVLEPIGISTPLDWRGTPKQYGIFHVSEKVGVVVPVDGDPFFGLPDSEAFRRFIHWEECSNTITPLPYVATLFNSLKKMKVERLSFTEMIEWEKQEEMRHQGAAARKRHNRR